MSKITVIIMVVCVMVLAICLCTAMLGNMNQGSFMIGMVLIVVLAIVSFDSMGAFQPVEHKKIDIVTEQRSDIVRDNKIQFYAIDDTSTLQSIYTYVNTEINVETSSKTSYIEYEIKSSILFGELPPDKINIYLANE